MHHLSFDGGVWKNWSVQDFFFTGKCFSFIAKALQDFFFSNLPSPPPFKSQMVHPLFEYVEDGCKSVVNYDSKVIHFLHAHERKRSCDSVPSRYQKKRLQNQRLKMAEVLIQVQVFELSVCNFEMYNFSY